MRILGTNLPEDAWFNPVAVATTGSNITLSGQQTIDGVVVGQYAAGDPRNVRALVKDQTNSIANGLYDTNSGTWTRCLDANDKTQWGQGVQVLVTGGTANGGIAYRCTTTPTNGQIIPGTSALTFAVSFFASANEMETLTLAMPAEFSVTGSPTSGNNPTITVAKANQNANLVYAGPSSGGAAAPSFRAIVAADLPASVPLAVTNDTNVTGSSAGQTLTLGWTGTLAAARLNANVVQGVTNDTNITATIAAQNLTFAWAGTLAVTRGGTGGGTASGTLLDNITGFSSTGFLNRTGAGTYTFSGSTGSGNVVLATSPTLVTPTLGAATATSINNVAITAPASAATLTIANNKTLTVNNSLTLAGTDATTITFQGTDTYVGRATTDTLTNKTLDTAGAGNVLKINGNQVSAVTGTGSTVALAAGPTFTGTVTISSTPNLLLGTTTTDANAPLIINANASASAPVAVGSGFSALHLVSADSNAAAFVGTSYGTASFFELERADGTGASPSAPTANELIGTIGFLAWTGASFGTGAAINAKVLNGFSGTDRSSYITIATVQSGAITQTEAVRINASGGVGIGTTTDPGIGALLAADLYSNDASFLIRTKTTLNNAAAAQTATLTNGPTAGNPTKWFSIDDNGTTRRVPAW